MIPEAALARFATPRCGPVLDIRPGDQAMIAHLILI